MGWVRLAHVLGKVFVFGAAVMLTWPAAGQTSVGPLELELKIPLGP
jgi:hypothetical protein